MKSLFILNNPKKLEQCLSAMSEEDHILLIEDAVSLCLRESSQSGFVLEEDLISRGYVNSSSNWKTIDYPKFVELTLEFDKAVTWL
ncbi:sulfurtransferase complex subunit TusB [Kangiella sediminilitoris]|uniref:Sulfur relay protein TusB/DsrH n=1 Tax=Kangiella sediminilitoris TaxID=1144748 RepID=A0A1B3BA53_9GAMM|nr:sulfurtransferase complex subunit TusB [Kangiella sediminilitoris]AOE49624.1 Sulfur relay protein TusB/DsrH [Kangiella sediminilitoris]